MNSELEKAINRAIPIYVQGGLSRAFYPAVDDDDIDGYVVDIGDWSLIVVAIRTSQPDPLDTP